MRFWWVLLLCRRRCSGPRGTGILRVADPECGVKCLCWRSSTPLEGLRSSEAEILQAQEGDRSCDGGVSGGE